MANKAVYHLKQAVFEANTRLFKAGLVVLTWGNASGVDREQDLVAIKPSGVAYEELTVDDIVLVSLSTGEALPGERLRPSSDTPTHVCLYQRFASIGGIAHAHSRHATGWAQACRPIPCYGTTHADTFHGPVPLCRPLTQSEIEDAYEWNTGTAIVECFQSEGLDPLHIPGALLPSHAPFAWGETPALAVENAVILEEVAALAWQTELLNPECNTVAEALVHKHFSRKHGQDAYYGQPKDES